LGGFKSPGDYAAFKFPPPTRHDLEAPQALTLAKEPRADVERYDDLRNAVEEPLVSYQINRQLSGWNLPPLATRAFGAH
jgi:hypothetical protein